MRSRHVIPVASGFVRRLSSSAMLLALCAGAMTSSVASAQIAPTREEIERRQPRTPAPPTQLQVEGDIEHTPCALDEPQFADVKFTLRTVEYSGLRGVDPAILQSAFASEVGRENPVSAVCRIRDKATAALRQAGYIAAVQVPEQSISEGD